MFMMRPRMKHRVACIPIGTHPAQKSIRAAMDGRAAIAVRRFLVQAPRVHQKSASLDIPTQNDLLTSTC